LLAVSAFYASSFLAILSLALIFWGLIMLYITPSKHVPLTLLEASTNSLPGNIERILVETGSNEKGVYLPPKNLGDFNASLIFVPRNNYEKLPGPDEVSGEIYSKNNDGIFVTPPGQGLCNLFEQVMGNSFTKLDLEKFESLLPTLLIETLELASDVQFTPVNNGLTIEITGNVLTGICKETDKYPHTHKQVGCLLSSALACCLAKTTGKLVEINNEITNPNSLAAEFYLEDVYESPISKMLTPAKQTEIAAYVVQQGLENERIAALHSENKTVQSDIESLQKKIGELRAKYLEIQETFEKSKKKPATN